MVRFSMAEGGEQIAVIKAGKVVDPYGQSDLTAEQKAFLAESEVRDATYPEVFLQREKWHKKLIGSVVRFLERVGVVKGQDRLEVVGGVGEELQVSIAGRNLREFLPDDPDYGFVGVPVIAPVEEIIPDPNETSSPRFNFATKKVELVVAVQAGAFGKETSKLKYNGLVALHEIGHAIDGAKNDRLTPVLVTNTSLHCMSDDPGMIYHNFRDVLGLASRGVDVKVEVIKEGIGEILRSRVDKQFEDRGKPSDMPNLARLWGWDVEAMKEEIFQRVNPGQTALVVEAIENAKSKDPGLVYAKLEEKLTLAKDNYRMEFDKQFAATIAESERAAWAEALKIYQILQKDNGIVLHKGKTENLFFEIDKLINAHGRAGRLGVKSASSREKLKIAD